MEQSLCQMQGLCTISIPLARIVKVNFERNVGINPFEERSQFICLNAKLFLKIGGVGCPLVIVVSGQKDTF